MRVTLLSAFLPPCLCFLSVLCLDHTIPDRNTSAPVLLTQEDTALETVPSPPPEGFIDLVGEKSSLNFLNVVGALVRLFVVI